MPPVIDGKGEKYMNKLKLNLRMFEGEGAAAGETGEGAAAAAEPQEPGTGQEPAEGQASQEPSVSEPEIREEAYERIRADYNDLIAKDIEKALNRRNAENQKMQNQLKA